MSLQSDLLKEVAEIVGGERSRDYGSASINLDQRTASLWNAYLANLSMNEYLNVQVDGVDVCNLMILLKIARIMESRIVKDNYADIAGYAAAAWEIINE
jgi:hypothetical protein